jgi:hypothetical protein
MHVKITFSETFPTCKLTIHVYPLSRSYSVQLDTFLVHGSHANTNTDRASNNVFMAGSLLINLSASSPRKSSKYINKNTYFPAETVPPRRYFVVSKSVSK